MNVLFLTDSFNYCCGRSKHIFLLAKYLKEAGHMPHVVIGGGDGECMLKAEGIPFTRMPSILHQNRTALNYSLAAVRIAGRLAAGKIDIVHAHHPYASSIARLATKALRIPHVYTIHGAVHNYGKLPSYTGDSFIAVSRATREFASSVEGSIREKIEVIYNGIDVNQSKDPQREEVRKRLGIDRGAAVVGIVGRIVKHKGHEYVLSALDELSRDYTKICCLIVGDGIHRPAVEEFARTLHVKVVFTGTTADVSPYISASDIIAIPSLANEGLPMTLLEAGAHAKPVVASAVEGIGDVIVHEQNGFLVAPGDPIQLKAALSRFIEDEAFSLQLGRRLRETIENGFSAEGMARKTLAHYDRLLYTFGRRVTA